MLPKLHFENTAPVFPQKGDVFKQPEIFSVHHHKDIVKRIRYNIMMPKADVGLRARTNVLYARTC